MYTWGSYNIAKVMHMQQSAIDGVENIHSSSKGSRYCSNGGKKRAYTIHTVCFCGKVLQSRDVFYSTIKQQSLFFVHIAKYGY